MQPLVVVVVLVCACVHASVVRLVQIVACDIMYAYIHTCRYRYSASAAHHVSTFFLVNGRPVRGFLSATRNARDSSRCPVHARHR